jgi:hypothetical protein
VICRCVESNDSIWIIFVWMYICNHIENMIFCKSATCISWAVFGSTIGGQHRQVSLYKPLTILETRMAIIWHEAFDLCVMSWVQVMVLDDWMDSTMVHTQQSSSPTCKTAWVLFSHIQNNFSWVLCSWVYGQTLSIGMVWHSFSGPTRETNVWKVACLVHLCVCSL